MGELSGEGKPADIASAPASSVEWSLRVLKLENRLQRERSARLQAEAVAEQHMRELYDKSRALQLLETIAAAANEKRAVEQTLRFTVEAVCRHAGWQFGNVFTLAPDGPRRFLPAGISYAESPERIASFVAVSQATEFAPGVGLPGRVLSTGRSHWIRDIVVDPGSPRAAAAGACGLHAAFAVPVLIGAEAVAAMEFFSRDRLDPDETLLNLVTQVGTQLGRVMERKRAEDKLIHDATHDPLTGLPNRALFTRRLEDAVALNAYGGPSAGFAVFFIDLDRFKLVNDSMGHAAGDAMLLEIARRLARALEAVGAAGMSAMLARLGGDEFTVLLEGRNVMAQARGVAASLLAALEPPMIILGQEIHSSASIGVASSEAGLADAAAIMRNADLAMYRAKAEGRARIEMFDASLHASAKRKLSLEHDLRQALEREEFTLRYQPIVDLRNSRPVAFEALLRWRREDRLVAPSEFIGFAEEAGLIVPIGEWVLRQACRMAAAVRRVHPGWAEADGQRPFAMSVNVSPRQFRQPDFVAQVVDAVEKSGALADAVRLEITEGMFMESSARASANLHELREFGVHFSIDDFGTGYSSLSYLHRLPVDTVKIDRSFVQGMEDRIGNEAIVKTIIDMAGNLGLAVVAEGVETPAQADDLRHMGCRYAQGFLFARPLDEADAMKLLAAAPV